VENDEEVEILEEFEVNFVKLAYVSKDLSEIKPYSFPVVIFVFGQVYDSKRIRN
jgi:hypothetical protein